jgi:hypothetical protein
VLLQHPTEVRGRHPDQPLVLEAEQQLRFALRSVGEPFGHAPLQKRRLAAAPDPDHGHRLAADAGHAYVARHRLAHRGG